MNIPGGGSRGTKGYFDPEEMDRAAEIAERDLAKSVPEESVIAVARWWQIHYRSTGHRRLGRILLKRVGTT